MDTSNTHNNNTLWFFKHKGFDDKNIHEIFKKCKRLEGVQKENLSENWDYLKKIGIHERKLPSIVTKCPRIMTLDLNEKLIPMVQCLATLGTKPNEVASAITKFPHILTHSVEEKLCPLLGFFESLGVSGTQVGKMLLHNPRIISYSIDLKLSGVVDFLAGIGLTKEGTIGKILVKNPSIMGYNVEKRLRPTTEFLLSLGVTKLDLQKVAINFPEVLCRDVDKILKPNCDYLKTRGFDSQQIATLVARYPPILIKSVKNSLEPRIRFLVEVMNRGLEEAADYPEFFQHGLKKRLERREKLLKQKNVSCSLSEMLDCNHKKFLSRSRVRCSPLQKCGAPLEATSIPSGRSDETSSKNENKQTKMSSKDGVPHWSVYDNIKIIPSNPNALMAEINSAISSLQYAKTTKFLNPLPPLPKNKKIVDDGNNSSSSSLYDARMAHDAYKRGLAYMAADNLEEAYRLLNAALSKCPPDKICAVAKIQSLISLTAQRLGTSTR
ncbi:Mitochodrial transcription termination factor-related protein [Artemisia annua]|uniref:Mitochodrial transcription termination factor-related protein n=1 Tax=Artemisia annua TaxID=35608 RepID=A0A2U1MK80_ARTAN|nr:Mitochodrial transcription termination factor-related protein [Artemisia annua]